MTLREPIARIRSEFKMHSSDTHLSDRAIAAELRSTAVKFLLQSVNKRKYINGSNIFTVIPCVNLEPIPLSDCCDFESNVTVSRSIYKIPKIAESSNYGMLMQGVYSVDGVSRKFREAYSIDRYVNALQLGLKGNDIWFWFQDGYLYVSDPLIEKVKLIAYFEEDIPDYFYSCDCTEECPSNPLDEEFKCPAGLVDDVVITVGNKLLQTYKRSVADNNSDGKEDSK